MSNIFTEKKSKNNDSKIISCTKQNNSYNNTLEKSKDFPSATKEWYNSIYAYNKNSIKTLPTSDKIITKLINNYFNFSEYFSETTRKKLKRFYLNKKRLSIKKIFVSKADLKHTNSKVVITVYIFNAIEKYLMRKLKKFDKIKIIMRVRTKAYKHKILKILRERQKYTKIAKRQIRFIIRKTPSLQKLSYQDETNFVSQCIAKNVSKLLKRKLKKEFFVLRYWNKVIFHKSKVKYGKLVPLISILDKVYQKKVEFNIVNLKYLYLNSDILSQSIAIKLKNRKNRLLRVLKSFVSMVKLPELKKFDYKYAINDLGLKPDIKNLGSFSANSTNDKNKDILHEMLLNTFNNKNSFIESSVLKSIDYKTVTGVRIEASGRLSRRFTASRSLFKFKYKGSLKDIGSSRHNVSSALLRGHAKPNIQYTKISSKTRNGSFGLKGWVSSE